MNTVDCSRMEYDGRVSAYFESQELLRLGPLPPKELSRIALAILMSEEVDSWDEWPTARVGGNAPDGVS